MSAACGPLMLSLAGAALEAEDRRRLCHPLVGGVILFQRNGVSFEALVALIAEIKALRTEAPPLIAVDQEGGRIQRFRDGFTPLPPATAYGRLHERSPSQALRAAALGGFVMATELREVGCDFSFAPVLDLADDSDGDSGAIGERSFHADPEVVAALATAFAQGMRAAGFAAVAKHYPGHGAVQADSHHECPRDQRPFARIEGSDLVPYRALIAAGLDGVMSAHVLYPAVDAEVATFSRFWLQQVLRHELGFNGALFSDDLVMRGAAPGGAPAERVRRALAAGCDMALACNDPDFMDAALHGLADTPPPLHRDRDSRLRPFLQPAAVGALPGSGKHMDSQEAAEELQSLLE